MLWFRIPERVYFKKGCMPVALDELKVVYGRKKAFIITDSSLSGSSVLSPLEKKLSSSGCQYTWYSISGEAPLEKKIYSAARAVSLFEPDVIIAVGSRAVIDCAKLMRVIYENPDVKLSELSDVFADIDRKPESFPPCGKKAMLAAIPSSAATGAEVSPAACYIDEASSKRRTIADYALMPEFVIVDSDFFAAGLAVVTASSCFTALTNAFEAYVSTMSSDYTDSLALKAIQILSESIPAYIGNGKADPGLVEKTVEAIDLAGIAAANAFGGVCSAMAQAAANYFGIPLGTAAAIMLDNAIEYNSGSDEATAEKYRVIADAAGYDSAVDMVKELRADCGISDCLSSYGVDEVSFNAALDSLTRAAANDRRLNTNPVRAYEEDVKNIFIAAYYEPQ